MNPGNSALIAIGKRLLLDAQGRKCSICHGRLDFGPFSGPISPTVEHVWPKSKFPGPAFGRVLLAHDKCNRHKADRLPSDEELAFLFAVNRRLGYTEAETARWDTPPLLLEQAIRARKVG